MERETAISILDASTEMQAAIDGYIGTGGERFINVLQFFGQRGIFHATLTVPGEEPIKVKVVITEEE